MARRAAALPVTFPAFAKRLVTSFALLAFLLQGFALQTHIHSQAAPVAIQLGVHAPAPAPLKSQDPIDQCRLCQELVHAGAFIAPASAVLVSGLAFVAAPFPAAQHFADRAATAFAWQSRAPPRR